MRRLATFEEEFTQSSNLRSMKTVEVKKSSWRWKFWKRRRSIDAKSPRTDVPSSHIMPAVGSGGANTSCDLSQLVESNP